MSTLEKFGILVILILVVIIGVVAVWGVGGEEKNPFAGEDVATVDPAAPVPPLEPGAGTPDWPNGTPAPTPATAGPVPPPALGSPPTPASSGGGLAPAPAPAAATTYTVQKGDTGDGIARKFGVKWQDISACNSKKDARRLKIGEVLKIPSSGGMAVAGVDQRTTAPPGNSLVPVSDLPRPNPADGPTETAPIRANAAPAPAAREVEVRSGDTLYEIARRELGDPNLYYRILKENPNLDPKKLRVGMKIRLPQL